MRGCASCALLLLWVAVVASCTRTHYVPVETHHREVVVWRDTVVEVVDAGERQERKTLDTVSVSRTRQACSRAAVSAGVLEHTLVVYPRRDSVRVQVRDILTHDSLLFSHVQVTPTGNGGETPRWLVVWATTATLVALTLLLVLLFKK